MHNLAFTQLLNDPGGQVIVLRTLVADPESAELPYQGGTIDPEVADHVVPEEKKWIPVAFEIRIQPMTAVVDLVFIGINQAGIRMPQDRIRHPEQGVFGEQIVMIQQGDVLPRDHFQGRIRTI